MTDADVPDRWFVALGGRTAPAADHTCDAVSLIVTERSATAGLGLEEAAIVRLCTSPTAVVEIAAHLGLPLGMVTVLLSGLIDGGHVTARHPQVGGAADPAPGADSACHGDSFPTWRPPEMALLERTLSGLRNL